MVESDGRRVSRLGFAAHGGYYLVLATLIGSVVLKDTSRTDTSAQGAIAVVAAQPFGRVLIVPVALGFLAYAGHRVVEARRADDWWHRLAEAARAVVWSALAVLAGRTVVTAGSGQGGQTEQSMTRMVLDWPAGPFLVGGVGLVILGVGCYQLVAAVRGDVAEELHALDLDERVAVRWLGRAGSVGRALAYGLVGVFVLVAAVTHDASESRGLDGALQEMVQRDYGRILVAVVALGFAAFGLFRLAESRYRFPESGSAST